MGNSRSKTAKSSGAKVEEENTTNSVKEGKDTSAPDSPTAKTDAADISGEPVSAEHEVQPDSAPAKESSEIEQPAVEAEELTEAVREGADPPTAVEAEELAEAVREGADPPTAVEVEELADAVREGADPVLEEHEVEESEKLVEELQEDVGETGAEVEDPSDGVNGKEAEEAKEEDVLPHPDDNVAEENSGNGLTAETQEVEPAVIGGLSTSNGGSVSNTPDESSRYQPRLCQLCKWADFDGYGFNLHAEKDKPGQYIGSVDPDSPAETGGLREGDRIIEVNGDNIESQTHGTVIQKIKAGGERTELLVVDRATDDYYKGQGRTVSKYMAGVLVIVTPSRLGDVDINSNEQSSEEVATSEPIASPAEEPLSLTVLNEELPEVEDAETAVANAEEEVTNTMEEVGTFGQEVSTTEQEVAITEPEVAITEQEVAIVEDEVAITDMSALPDPTVDLDDETEAVTAVVAEQVETAPEPPEAEEPEAVLNGTEVDEVVVTATDVAQTEAAAVVDEAAVAAAAAATEAEVQEEEVVGEAQVEVNAYEEVEFNAATTQSLDQDLGTSSNGINGGTVASVPEPEPEPIPEPVIKSTAPAPAPEPEAAVIRSTTSAAVSDTGLDLHLSAAEMKERLRARKKQDPRLQKTSFEAKHKMFERM